MDYSWVWKAVLIVIIGSMLLRIAGRKSIAKMTVAQTVIMIAIGTLLIQPVSERNVWITFAVAATLVATLLVLEYLQVKINVLEILITSKSVPVIIEGALQVDTLRKIRMTVDQLEIQLRQSGISRISDVKYATVEPNGRLGYVLQEWARPATRQDLQALAELINSKLPGGSGEGLPRNSQPDELFLEVLKQPNQPKSPPKLR